MPGLDLRSVNLSERTVRTVESVIPIDDLVVPTGIKEIIQELELSDATTVVDKRGPESVLGTETLVDLPRAVAIEKILIQEFAERKPDILFIADYVVNDVRIGALIVFERYLNATHYEVFKKNKFDNEPKFERILFLGVTALEQETKNFLPYLDFLGFSLSERSVFVVFDNNIKQDRIYEFFVRGAYVPSRAEELNFLSTLKSKNMVQSVQTTENATIKSLSASYFDTADASWVISLLNGSVPFFGSALSMLKDQTVFLPKDLVFLMKVINDSIFLFGVKKALMHLLSVVARGRKLGDQVSQAFSDAINDSNGVFSFDSFKSSLRNTSSIFKAFSDQNVLIKKTGTLSVTSFKNLSLILNFLQEVDIAISAPIVSAQVAAALSAAAESASGEGSDTPFGTTTTVQSTSESSNIITDSISRIPAPR